MTAAEAALNGGYGAPLAGMVAGATAGVATGGSTQNMAVAGVAGAVVGA